MDEGTPPRDDNRGGTSGGKRSGPTDEQLAAREELRDARRKNLERKTRTRRLIQVGGVMSAWGIDTPEQAEELMKRLTSEENKDWRRFLLGRLKARLTDRWPKH